MREGEEALLASSGWPARQRLHSCLWPGSRARGRKAPGAAWHGQRPAPRPVARPLLYSRDVPKHDGRTFLPRPSGLHNHGHEHNSLAFAGLSSVHVCFFVPGVSVRSRSRLSPRQSQSLLPLRRRNGEIQCSRVSGKGGEINVSGAAPSQLAVLRPLGKQNALRLFFRLQTGALRPLEDEVPYSVVASGTLTPCAAHSGVVVPAIQDAIALGAPTIFSSLWQAEAGRGASATQPQTRPAQSVRPEGQSKRHELRPQLLSAGWLVGQGWRARAGPPTQRHPTSGRGRAVCWPKQPREGGCHGSLLASPAMHQEPRQKPSAQPQ